MIDNRLIDGRAVQARILTEVAEYVQKVSSTSPVGRLVSISIGDVPEVGVYIRNQAKAAEKTGIPFEQIFWADDMPEEECKKRIVEMNDDADVLGVILQRPIPGHINVRSLQSAVHPVWMAPFLQAFF